MGQKYSRFQAARDVAAQMARTISDVVVHDRQECGSPFDVPPGVSGDAGVRATSAVVAGAGRR
jgi:hypothetical protein